MYVIFHLRNYKIATIKICRKDRENSKNGPLKNTLEGSPDIKFKNQI